jgi:hypothetical protein
MSSFKRAIPAGCRVHDPLTWCFSRRRSATGEIGRWDDGGLLGAGDARGGDIANDDTDRRTSEQDRVLHIQSDGRSGR